MEDPLEQAFQQAREWKSRRDEAISLLEARARDKFQAELNGVLLPQVQALLNLHVVAIFPANGNPAQDTPATAAIVSIGGLEYELHRITDDTWGIVSRSSALAIETTPEDLQHHLLSLYDAHAAAVPSSDE